MLLTTEEFTLPVWGVTTLVGVLFSALGLWYSITKTITRLDIKVSDLIERLRELETAVRDLSGLPKDINSLNKDLARQELEFREKFVNLNIRITELGQRIEVVAQRAHDALNASQAVILKMENKPL